MNLCLTVLTVLSFKTTVAGGIALEIFENSGSSSAQLFGKVETRSGRNLFLSCKIFSSEGGYFDPETVWSKRRERFKEEVLASNNLSFVPIKLRNRGRYFCASLRYGLHKIIYVAVKPLERIHQSPKKKRWKRADIIPSSTFASYDHDTSKDTPESFSTPLPTYGYHNHEWHPEILTMYPEIKRLYNEKQNQQFEHSSTPQKARTFSYAGVIAAVVAIILIVGALLYRLVKRFDLLYAISPERISEVEPECRHPTCGQYCTFAANNMGENGGQNHYNVHMLNVNSAHASNIPTLRILPSTNNLAERNNQTSVVDLPPSYDNSVKNCDKYDLPPSYNEALSYMSVSGLQHMQRGFGTQHMPRNT